MASVINQEQRTDAITSGGSGRFTARTNPLAPAIRVWLHQTNEILIELFQAR
jgi:hypothetical protein